jgi:NarL family two-component system response regulator LiaR
MPIRVLIVDDHQMVREGLATFLKTALDLELVGEAADGESAVERCSRDCPDVVLMDLVMPDVDGVAATRAIRERCPDTQIIALTSFGDEARIQAVLEAGAIGYLLKNVPPKQLAEAVRNAHAGRPTLAPEAAQALMQAAIRPPEVGHDLTERELEVLALLVDGLTNAQIAQQLTISISTAKFHVSTILSKLNVASRTEAVSLALQHKIIEPE